MRTTAGDPGPSLPLDSIDLYDPDRYRDTDLHPAWATLRREAPMWAQRTPSGERFWSVTGYHDVTKVLLDDRNFSSAHGTILAVARGDSAGGKTINLMDRPRHARVRVPTMRIMSSRVVRDRKEIVRGHVRDLLDELWDHDGPVDVADVMLRLPMAGTGEILGIPPELWADISRWAMAGVAPTDPAYATGTEAQTLHLSHHELMSIFSALVGERRIRRGEDLVSTLLDVDFDDGPISEQEVLINCYTFVMGAVTTTAHVALQMLVAFADQPKAWAAVRADPGLIPGAVEEGLRWASPTNHIMRRVTAPVRFRDVLLEPGELVCAWVPAANRDETVFANPYVFDPARDPNPHVAFGVGVHRCVGGPAAQLVLAVLLEELRARVTAFEPAGEPTHLRSNFINGITRLPLHLRTAGVAG